MGADAKLFLFDYKLYREEIVPAFLKLMIEGTVAEWLRELLRAKEDEFGRNVASARNGFAPADFLECCTYIDSTFAVTDVFAKTTDEYDGTWKARSCRNAACPVLHSCTFHRIHGDQLHPVADDWTRWLQM